jgi:hypothetical protein
MPAQAKSSILLHRSPHLMRFRALLLEHCDAPQPIRHMRHSLAFGQETRMASVIASLPAAHKLAVQHARHELELVQGSFLDRIHAQSMAP